MLCLKEQLDFIDSISGVILSGNYDMETANSGCDSKVIQQRLLFRSKRIQRKG